MRSPCRLPLTEARMGHAKLADEIRTLIDKAKTRPRFVAKNTIPLARPRGEASELSLMFRIPYVSSQRHGARADRYGRLA